MPRRRRRRRRVQEEHTPLLASDVRFIRILRNSFFVFLILFAVYLYILYEAGEASTFLWKIWDVFYGITLFLLRKAWELIVFIIELVIQYPLIAIAVTAYSALFIYIGYFIAMRRG